jgi:hypothetical protein
MANVVSVSATRLAKLVMENTETWYMELLFSPDCLFAQKVGVFRPEFRSQHAVWMHSAEVDSLFWFKLIEPGKL